MAGVTVSWWESEVDSWFIDICLLWVFSGLAGPLVLNI